MLTGYANDFVGYLPAAVNYTNLESYRCYQVPYSLGNLTFRSDVGELLVSQLVTEVEALLT